MNALETVKESFLNKLKFKTIQRVKLEQDASNRTYERIVCDSDSFILMHYPCIEGIKKFIAISKMLSKGNFYTPNILEIDQENCLVLLEDFGDMSINKYISSVSDKTTIYKKIVNVLCSIQNKIPQETLEVYTNKSLVSELNIMINYYFPYINLDVSLGAQYINIWQEIFKKKPRLKHVFVHRDFHVDNLFLLQNNEIGILDFQDAVYGSHVYDLVSLLDDARIEVEESLRDNILNHYISISNVNKDAILDAYHVLGAQRNGRILGVFARKAIDGNAKYLKLMPRVASYF